AVWGERALAAALTVVLLAILLVTIRADPGTRPLPLPWPSMPIHLESIPHNLWVELKHSGTGHGANDAADTLVVFVDYECPWSASAAPMIDSLLVMHPSL